MTSCQSRAQARKVLLRSVGSSVFAYTRSFYSAVGRLSNSGLSRLPKVFVESESF